MSIKTETFTLRQMSFVVTSERRRVGRDAIASVTKIKNKASCKLSAVSGL